MTLQCLQQGREILAAAGAHGIRRCTVLGKGCAGRDRDHGLAALFQPGGQPSGQSFAIRQHQPATLVAQAGRTVDKLVVGDRALPRGHGIPVARIKPAHLSPTIPARVWRQLDPEALALEGVGRQRDTLADFTATEAGPIDHHIV